MILEDYVTDYLTEKQLNTFKGFNPKEMEDLTEWDNIPNIQIAIYLILINSKPKQKVKSNTKRQNILKLRDQLLIRKAENDIRDNSITWYAGDIDYLYNSEVINGVLGEYGKYFIMKSKVPLEDDDKWQTKVREYKKENLIIDKPRVMLTDKDELLVLRKFFDEVELIKDELHSMYLEYKTLNHNNKESKKPTDIDETLKNMLKKRLIEIGTSKTKINSLTPKAIKAIKKELLQL